MSKEISRRRFLELSAGLTVALLVGCEGDEGIPTAQKKFESVLKYMAKSKTPILVQTSQEFREMAKVGIVYFRDDNSYSSNTFGLELDLWGGWPDPTASEFRIVFLEPKLYEGYSLPILVPSDEELAVSFAYYNIYRKIAKEMHKKDPSAFFLKNDEIQNLAKEQLLSQLPENFPHKIKVRR